MKRNPFARGEYVRKAVVDHYGHCNFCGTHKARMYAYAWSPDDKPIDKRSVDTLLKFCDFQCFEAYHC